MKIATAAYPLDPLTTWADYANKITHWVIEAAQNGAELLVFPEYASMELAMLAGPAGAQAFINFAKGYADEMAKHPGIEVVFRREMLLTRENGLKNLAQGGQIFVQRCLELFQWS